MKNFKLFLALIIFATSAIFSMEKMVQDDLNQSVESHPKIKPTDKISRLPQNIWTALVPMLIDRNGKTEAEIFRITDLMFYPKVNQDPKKIISQSPDKEKVARQLALAKSLNNYIKTVGKEKAIKNYKEFKEKILNEIIKNKVMKIIESEAYINLNKKEGTAPELSPEELRDFDWEIPQQIARYMAIISVRARDEDLLRLILNKNIITYLNFPSPNTERPDNVRGGILHEAMLLVQSSKDDNELKKNLAITKLLLQHGANPKLGYNLGNNTIESAQWLLSKDPNNTLLNKARFKIGSNEAYRQSYNLEKFIDLLKQAPKIRKQFLKEQNKIK